MVKAVPRILTARVVRRSVFRAPPRSLPRSAGSVGTRRALHRVGVGPGGLGRSQEDRLGCPIVVVRAVALGTLILVCGCFEIEGSSCPEGANGCPCLELRCEAGLECRGGVCVPPEVASSGTSSSTSSPSSESEASGSSEDDDGTSSSADPSSDDAGNSGASEATSATGDDDTTSSGTESDPSSSSAADTEATVAGTGEASTGGESESGSSSSSETSGPNEGGDTGGNPDAGEGGDTSDTSG